MTQNEYKAGVCNIGSKETARRKMIGWLGIVIAVLILALCMWLRLNSWWRLLVFFPASLAASGFLQAYFHFCSGFAYRGVFNFGAIGQTKKINDEASKTKDLKKGNQIVWSGVVIGIIVALVCVFI